jgi:S-disulfanyl-L-cysteine oxidoreductase SoxD
MLRIISQGATGTGVKFMSKVRFSVVSALAASVTAIAFGISAAQPTTINDGVYTAEQAETGKEIFERRCSACHNAEFYRGTFANRSNQPLAYLFEEILVTMPADMPGSLTDPEYEAILAQILELVGYPAGDVALNYNNGSMHNIRIVPPGN